MISVGSSEALCSFRNSLRVHKISQIERESSEILWISRGASRILSINAQSLLAEWAPIARRLMIETGSAMTYQHRGIGTIMERSDMPWDEPIIEETVFLGG